MRGLKFTHLSIGFDNWGPRDIRSNKVVQSPSRREPTHGTRQKALVSAKAELRQEPPFLKRAANASVRPMPFASDPMRRSRNWT